MLSTSKTVETCPLSAVRSFNYLYILTTKVLHFIEKTTLEHYFNVLIL